MIGISSDILVALGMQSSKLVNRHNGGEGYDCCLPRVVFRKHRANCYCYVSSLTHTPEKTRLLYKSLLCAVCCVAYYILLY